MVFVCVKDLWESNAELGLVSIKACTVSSTVPSEEVGSIGKVGSDSVGTAGTKTTALMKNGSVSHTSSSQSCAAPWPDKSTRTQQSAVLLNPVFIDCFLS